MFHSLPARAISQKTQVSLVANIRLVLSTLLGLQSVSVMSKREEPSSSAERLAEPPAKKLKDSATASENAFLYSSRDKGIMEKDVGITEYLGHHTGFQGSLKQRYTDFLVNEISSNGKVLHVEHVPVQVDTVKEKKPANTNREDPSKQPSEGKLIVADPEAEKELREILGEDCTQAASKIIANIKDFKTVHVTSRKFENKTERGRIHQLIRLAYGGAIDSQTTNESRFSLRRAGGNNSRSKGNSGRGKSDIVIDPYVARQAGEHSQFVEFNIYKVNKESMDVCRLLCKYLRKDSKSITVAGTKDRRGVTVQRASIRQVGVDRLVNLNKALKDILLSDFKYTNRMLKLGELFGNMFVITIRDTGLPEKDSQNSLLSIEEVVGSSLTSLREQGFINYFGMQRFGTFSVSTHEIGLQILKGEYAQAVRLILYPQPLALEESKLAREQYERDPNDIDAVIKLMPSQCSAECAVLRGLQRNPTDMLGALMQIPRNLRLMFVHAYQSFVWNSVVSARIRNFGIKVLEGDLVVAEDHQDKFQSTVIDVTDDFEEDVLETRHPEVRALTKVEVESGNYTIYDVVMPSPGFDVIYPEPLTELYEDVMSPHNLSPHSMHRNVKEFSLSGAYRHIMAKPISLEWNLRHYDSPFEQLVNTDLEVLENKAKGINCSHVKEQASIPTGPRVGVVVTMKLGTAQYATMALRCVYMLFEHD